MATAINVITFSSRGNNYTATSKDIFMENGTVILFIKNGKQSDPMAKRVELGKKEWLRIKPQLIPVDYEKYYGRKPLVNGVNIYQVK